MLIDIQNKYPLYLMPATIKLSQISRILSIYDIPESYSILLPQVTNTYCSSGDIYSKDFNAELTLANRNIESPYFNIPPKDNISKFKIKNGIVIIISDTNNIPIKKDITKTPREKPINIIDRISMTSSHERNIDISGNICFKESPLMLIYNIMKERCRAHVIIRNRNR
jgi:hypothetical protein